MLKAKATMVEYNNHIWKRFWGNYSTVVETLTYNMYTGKATACILVQKRAVGGGMNAGKQGLG